MSNGEKVYVEVPEEYCDGCPCNCDDYCPYLDGDEEGDDE